MVEVLGLMLVNSQVVLEVLVVVAKVGVIKQMDIQKTHKVMVKQVLPILVVEVVVQVMVEVDMVEQVALA